MYTWKDAEWDLSIAAELTYGSLVLDGKEEPNLSINHCRFTSSTCNLTYILGRSSSTVLLSELVNESSEYEWLRT